jgi:hypothetical protein
MARYCVGESALSSHNFFLGLKMHLAQSDLSTSSLRLAIGLSSQGQEERAREGLFLSAAGVRPLFYAQLS